MGEWTPENKTTVASMPSDDFFANEKSVTISAAQAGGAKIVFTAKDGSETIQKKSKLLNRVFCFPFT